MSTEKNNGRELYQTKDGKRTDEAIWNDLLGADDRDTVDYTLPQAERGEPSHDGKTKGSKT